MNEPKRLLDDPSTSAGVRELLANAAPAPPLEAAVRAQIADSVVHVAASVNAAGASAIVGKWIIAGVTAVAVVGGGAGIWAVSESTTEHATERSEAVESHPSASRMEVPRVAVIEDAPPEAPEEVSAPIEAPPRVERPRLAPTSIDPIPTVELPAETPPAEGVSAEARSLEGARQLLARDPAGALARANAHRTEFPRAQLVAESDLIAIDALVRLGRIEEARARGRSLVARRSFYADRVRALVGDPVE